MSGLLQSLHLCAEGLHLHSLLLGKVRDLGLLDVSELQRLIEPLHHLRRVHHATEAASPVTHSRSAGTQLVARRRGRRRSGLILGSEYRARHDPQRKGREEESQE